MKLTRLIIAVGVGIASTGAFAETGVNVGDIGYVGKVYGRAATANVAIAGPLTTRPGDVTVAGRDPAQGPTEILVQAKEADVNEVFGRT